MTVPPKPEPISKPLVAGSDIIACAILASSRSKTGSPSAAGTPVQTHATAPPMESFSTLTCRGDVGRDGEIRGEMESFSTLTCRGDVGRCGEIRGEMESFSTLTCRGDMGRYGEIRGEMESFSTSTCRGDRGRYGERWSPSRP